MVNTGTNPSDLRFGFVVTIVSEIPNKNLVGLRASASIDVLTLCLRADSLTMAQTIARLHANNVRPYPQFTNHNMNVFQISRPIIEASYLAYRNLPPPPGLEDDTEYVY